MLDHPKLLFLVSSLSAGGAERVTTNLANYWAARNWDVTLATLTPQAMDFFAVHPKVQRIGLDLFAESAGSTFGLLRNMHRVLVLRRLLMRIRPSIAVAMISEMNVLLALAAYGLTHIHAVGSELIHPPQWPLPAPWEKLRAFTYALLSAVVAQTEETAAWLRRHTRARRIQVIPNAAAWPLSPQSPVVPPDTICPTGRLLLLSVGRTYEQKQYALLLDVFRSLATRHETWDLVILGDGPQRLALEAQARAAGLGDRIFLPGRVGNVGEWYQRADLFVMSSRFEGFPNALLEALSYGVPVVSFDCETGPRDIIRNNLDGVLVPPGNAKALGEALERLMTDSVLRRAFANRALDVRSRFSMDRVAGLWEELFEKISQ